MTACLPSGFSSFLMLMHRKTVKEAACAASFFVTFFAVAISFFVVSLYNKQNKTGGML